MAENGEGKKARVAVLISGGGTNLQAIIDKWQAGGMPHAEPVLVVSSRRTAGGLARAEKAGIKNVFIGKEGFEEKLTKLLDEERIDMIVLAGFLKILSADFVKRWPDRILNVHPSLIPSFCGDGFYGLKVHEAALDYGVKVTGATVHFVNEVTDGGRIIAQKAVYVEDGDTPETLQRRVMEQAEWILLPQAVEDVARGLVEKGLAGE
jgi:phosphoribosylglycinamide formyltransferase-1